MKSQQPFVHELAQLEPGAQIGPGTRVWAGAHIRTGARVGAGCVVGRDVTIDCDVVVGDNCKLQNAALLYRGVRLADGVFVGPGAVLTNDRHPRAIDAAGAQLTDADWELSPTEVGRGASIGANATIVAGVRIGEWALVAAGAVVTNDVEPHALVAGVPARRIGWVCACGARVDRPGLLECAACATLRDHRGSGFAARGTPPTQQRDDQYAHDAAGHDRSRQQGHLDA